MTASDDQREAERELREALTVATEGPWVFDMDPNDLGISYQVWQSVPIHGDGHLIAKGLIEEDALLMCAVREHLPTILAALSSRPALPAGEEAVDEVLRSLNECHESGGIDYSVYSELHDQITALASRPSSPSSFSHLPPDYAEQKMVEAKDMLDSLADRVDEFVYQELAAILDDLPLDANGDSYRDRARPSSPRAGDEEALTPERQDARNRVDAALADLLTESQVADERGKLIAVAKRDISDAERCEAMHVTPSTGTLLRRLREVVAALESDGQEEK